MGNIFMPVLTLLHRIMQKYQISCGLGHGLGEVKQLYGVNTKHSEKELMPKVKAKMEERKNPSSKPWDEKKKILTSCYLIEERENDFYCNCYKGIQGRMCENTIGMYFRPKSGKIPLTEDVRSIPISQKRTRGRPKQLPKACLTRSPPRAVPAPVHLLYVSTEDMEVQDPAEREEPAAVLELPCTLCQEDGVQAVAEVSCAECGDNLCIRLRHSRVSTLVILEPPGF